MVTQGTNEGGSNMNRNRSGNGQRGNYAGRPVRNGERDSRKDNEGRYENRGGDRRNDRAPRYSRPENSGNNGQNRYGKGEGTRPNKPYDRNHGYISSPRFAGKDDDEEDNSRRSRPSRPKENRSSVTIPDKNKVMLRLEKEQKSMKKKQSKKKESSRPQPRVKRANNVNYTKNYANGDYDEYEDYYDL